MSTIFEGNITLVLTFFMILSVTTSSQAECNSAIPPSTPTTDFVDHNDGTVTHIPTGLMWKVCSEGRTWSPGSCSGSSSLHNWATALQIPSTLNDGGGFANHSDWRLPNLKELSSITEKACFPRINDGVFPSLDFGNFWTASIYERSKILSINERSWYVDFSSRFAAEFNAVQSREISFAVRLVRDEM